MTSPKVAIDFPIGEFAEAMVDDAKLKALMEQQGWSATDVITAAEQLSQAIFAQVWRLGYRKTF